MLSLFCRSNRCLDIQVEMVTKNKILFRQRKERSLGVVSLMIQMDSSEIHVLEETLIKNHAFALFALEKDTPISFVKCSIPIYRKIPNSTYKFIIGFLGHIG